MGTAISTPYDDVFRTLLNDCSELIIPVINEAFGEHYLGNERIVFSQNEHFINGQDGESEKRITDSCFDIIGSVSKKYLCECQSTPDNSMLVRIFEYATQIALDEGELHGNVLEITFPNSVILFLRSTKSTPDQMKIRMMAENGILELDVRVMKIQQYTLRDIFEKNLLFLIPFYIFLEEPKFQEYDSSELKLETLIEEYREITNELRRMQEQGGINTYTSKTLSEMTNKVFENLTMKYQNIWKGVSAVMGGKVLEYEAKTILNRGIGIGEARGELGKARKVTINLHETGMDEDMIARIVDVSVEQVREWLGMLPV